MKVAYPSDPLDGRAPDGAFAEEYAALSEAGVTILLLSSEEFDAGRVRVRPALQPGDCVLYRGWMLTPEAYTRWADGVKAAGATAVTNASAYRRAHHLPEWYSTCADLTPQTVVLPRDADFEAALGNTNWPGYFVKDYVKSLTTKRGSIARTPREIAEIVRDIEKYRGAIEGGVCVREFESLVPGSEERYFAFGSSAFAREGEPPPLVRDVAGRMNLPFISIDVAQREDGVLRLIELGDGQVSDRKRWDLQKFARLLADFQAR